GMSGIVGVVNWDGAPVDRRLVERMTATVSGCGPDGQHVWTDGPVGFGHAWLRTSATRDVQPCSLEARVWITADARIDGRPELVRTLRAHGCHDLAETTDAELILHAYAVWGEACVSHLFGDFSFAIWDGARRRVLCARD